ncbi:MAG: AI-2E family transporter [Rubrobacteraceae bacterium]
MGSNGQDSNKTSVGRPESRERKRRPTRIPISRQTGKLLALAGIAALILIAWFVPSALYIAVGGFALALILSFPVGALSRIVPRWLAILVTYLVLVGLLILAFVFLVPLLVDQLGSLISAAPDIARSADRLARSLLQPLAERNMLQGASPEQVISDFLNRLSGRAQDLAQNLLGGLAGFVSGVVNFGINLIGALFVSVYLLLDVRRIKAVYLRTLPHRYRWDGRELWNAEGASLSKYLGGLAFVVVIQGTLTAIGLFLLGIPYALLLGAWVSVTSIIPYLGAFLGAIPGIIVAFFISPTRGILAAFVYLGIQQLEGNVLTPRIQGQVLRVHPIIVLLAIVVGGGLGGLVGIIVAVPTLAVLRVLFDFFRVRLSLENTEE